MGARRRSSGDRARALSIRVDCYDVQVEVPIFGLQNANSFIVSG